MKERLAAVMAIAAFALATAAGAQPACTDCGVVQSIRQVEQQGQASGVGAYAGNQVEKNAKKTTSWSVAIRMDSGQTRTFSFSSKPAVREGERVKLVDGGRRLALVAP